MPNLIFCHPITNCYHRKLDEHGADRTGGSEPPVVQSEVTTKAQPISYSSVVAPRAEVPPVPASEQFVSSFFMGLTFSNGLRSVDLTSTIQVLHYYVHPSETLQISW